MVQTHATSTAYSRKRTRTSRRTGAAWAALGVMATTLATPSAAADKPLRLGVLASMSSQGSQVGGRGAVEAARMAMEDFGPEVLGRKIEILSADMQDKPEVGSVIAREWYDVQGVQAIFDLPNSAVALAVLDVARQRNRIVVTSGAGTTEFSGRLCAPTGFQWVFDTYGLSSGTAKALTRAGGKRWYLMVSDFAFGHSLQRNATATVQAEGGQVVGSVRHPVLSLDLSSPLLLAQQARPDVIGLAEGPPDNVNAVKQAAEFGLTNAGIKLAAFYMSIADVHGLGLAQGKGLLLTEAFYWDRDEDTRAWSSKFMRRHGAMPTMEQAGVYSSVLHYLKAVKAAGTDAGPEVAARMRAIPVEDSFARRGEVRVDGRMLHDMLLVQVKAPEESRGPWDYYKVVQVIPAAETAVPLEQSECPAARAQRP